MNQPPEPKPTRSFPPSTMTRLLSLASFLIKYGADEIGKRVATEACTMSTATLQQLKTDLRYMVFHEEPLLMRDGCMSLLTQVETPQSLRFEGNVPLLLHSLFKSSWMAAQDNPLAPMLAEWLVEAFNDVNTMLNWFDDETAFLFGWSPPDESAIVKRGDIASVVDRIALVSALLEPELPKIGLKVEYFSFDPLTQFVESTDIPNGAEHIMVVRTRDGIHELEIGERCDQFVTRAASVGAFGAIKQIVCEIAKQQRESSR